MKDLSKYQNLLRLREDVATSHRIIIISEVSIASTRLISDADKEMLRALLLSESRTDFGGQHRIADIAKEIMLAEIDKQLYRLAKNIQPVLDHVTATLGKKQ